MRRFLGFAGLVVAFLVVLSWVRDDEKCAECRPLDSLRRRGL